MILRDNIPPYNLPPPPSPFPASIPNSAEDFLSLSLVMLTSWSDVVKPF